MRSIFLLTAVWGSAALAANAPPSPRAPATTPVATVAEAPVDLARCDSLLKSIALDERYMAISKGDVMDNSAVRLTNRLLEVQILQQAQAMKLSMMIAMRCPSLPERSPAQGGDYMGNGIDCATARMAASPDRANRCDVHSWPNPFPPKSP